MIIMWSSLRYDGRALDSNSLTGIIPQDLQNAIFMAELYVGICDVVPCKLCT